MQLNNRIIIDLDNECAASIVDASLAELVKRVIHKWPPESTCATQEIDGEILFWDANISEVKKARSEANTNSGLMPLIGIKHQVDAVYFEISEQAYLARDWEVAVVTEIDCQCVLHSEE